MTLKRFSLQEKKNLKILKLALKKYRHKERQQEKITNL
jgi:hypothetical protein